jgi:hypothetical protein
VGWEIVVPHETASLVPPVSDGLGLLQEEGCVSFFNYFSCGIQMVLADGSGELFGPRRGCLRVGKGNGEVGRGDDLVEGHVVKVASSLHSFLCDLRVQRVGVGRNEDVIDSAVVMQLSFPVGLEGGCPHEGYSGVKVELGTHGNVVLIHVGCGMSGSICGK